MTTRGGAPSLGADGHRARRTAPWTVGVEEEFHVVDVTSGALVPRALDVLPDDDPAFSPELQQSSVETRTEVHTDLGDLRADLVRLRARLADAADRVGLAVVAAGTAPVADLDAQRITDAPRYHHLQEHFRELAREQLICACQTHVGFPDPDDAVVAMNRVRRWLPVLLALSTSSPYWRGHDTGYASYRTQVWSRWPTAGIPDRFDDHAQYLDVAAQLQDGGAVGDAGMLYWDVRPSAHVDTLEFRVADACATVDEVLVQTALSRALARTAYEAAWIGAPDPVVRRELLRLAAWRAARSGLTGDLLDPVTARPAAAVTMVERLLTHVRAALEDAGDWAFVREAVDWLVAAGTSAERQRRAAGPDGDLRTVVSALAAETRRA